MSVVTGFLFRASKISGKRACVRIKQRGEGEIENPKARSMGSHLCKKTQRWASHQIGVLSAPINVSSRVREDNEPPKYVAKDMVEKIRKFRNLIHPARALKEAYDPRTFTHEHLKELEEIYESVMHSLIYYL